MFIGNFGKWSVYVALVAFVVSGLLCFLKSEKLSLLRRGAFYLGSTGLIAAFLSLSILFLKDQFQFEYIYGHSSKENPWNYKLASVWTAQQGSFLLWALFSAIFGMFTLARSEVYERAYTGAFTLFLGVLSGILAFETPFNLLKDVTIDGFIHVPPDGTGMVPSLQNYWVTIHPPTMFVGFASLTVPFAYGVAAMITGDHQRWVTLCRAVSLFGLAVLGLGISMGGLWAYETQGWGGFWAWDPVENVSLVPWLLLVAVTHGLIVQSARQGWISANLLMSGLPFLSFVYGTFLTRSGLLDKVSVHSFASMDRNALQILRAFFFAVLAGYLVLYAWKGLKAGRDQKKPEVTGINRTSLYQAGMLTMCLLSFVVAVGMSWAVITALGGKEGARVEEGVYHKAVVWFFVPIMVLMAVTPFASWRAENLKSIFSRVINLAFLSLGVVGVMLILFKHPEFGVGIKQDDSVAAALGSGTLPKVPVMALLLFLCVFPALSNLWRAFELFKKSKMGIGAFVAHFGMAVFLGGLIISRGFEREAKMLIREDQSGAGLGYKIAFKDYNPERGYDRNNVVKFDVVDDRGRNFEIDPTLYYYRSGDKEQAQVWPFIKRELSHDTYFFMSPPKIEFWEEPLTIAPGETKTRSDVSVKYVKSTMKGQFGTPGAEFGGIVEITYEGNTYRAEPTLKLGDGALEPSLPKIGPDFRIVAMRKDPKDNSLTLQLLLSPPLYPMQLFYKPLTVLVWAGTGIFTLGGLISAFYRRVRKRAPENDYLQKDAKISVEDNNASIATA
jgi:cytochrome c-type biogenesis protein CcmF